MRGREARHFRMEKRFLIIWKRADEMAQTPHGPARAAQPRKASCSALWPGRRTALLVKHEAKPQDRGGASVQGPAQGLGQVGAAFCRQSSPQGGGRV